MAVAKMVSTWKPSVAKNIAQKAADKKQSQQEQIVANNVANYEKAYQGVTDSINSTYDAYAQSLQSQANANKGTLASNLANNQGQINTQYDKSANNAYIAYKQNQRDLPEKLSMIGANGGASESANIKLQTAYGQNLSNNENSRNSALSSAYSDYSNKVADIDSNTASAIGQANLQRGSQLADIQSNIAGYRADQQATIQPAVQQAYVDAYNNSANDKISEMRKKGYAINTWTNEDGTVHWNNLGNVTAINNKNQKAIANLQKKGYEVRTWTNPAEDNAIIHYAKVGKANSTTSSTGGSGGKSSTSAKGSSGGSKGSSKGSSGGSGGSGGGSGGGGSEDKPKEEVVKIDYARLNNFKHKYASKMLTDQKAVLKALENSHLNKWEKNEIIASMNQIAKKTKSKKPTFKKPKLKTKIGYR